MQIRELSEDILDELMIWSRKGNQVVRKYRCTSGKRAGRIVSKISQCFKPIDIKKRVKLKQTKARLGNRMSRKAKRTKRTNPASKRLKQLNKFNRRK